MPKKDLTRVKRQLGMIACFKGMEELKVFRYLERAEADDLVLRGLAVWTESLKSIRLITFDKPQLSGRSCRPDRFLSGYIAKQPHAIAVIDAWKFQPTNIRIVDADEWKRLTDDQPVIFHK